MKKGKSKKAKDEEVNGQGRKMGKKWYPRTKQAETPYHTQVQLRARIQRQLL